MNLDELKQEWNRMSNQAEELRQENMRLKYSLTNNRYTSSRQRLFNRLRRQMIVCAIWPVLLISVKDIFDVLGPTLYLIYILFFIISALLQLRLMHRLKEIDLSQMSVKEAFTEALAFHKLYQRQKVVGYILGIPVLIMLFYAIYNTGSEAILIGGIAGLIVGSIIGYIIDSENRRLIRRMTQELRRSLDDESI